MGDRFANDLSRIRPGGTTECSPGIYSGVNAPTARSPVGTADLRLCQSDGTRTTNQNPRLQCGANDINMTVNHIYDELNLRLGKAVVTTVIIFAVSVLICCFPFVLGFETRSPNINPHNRRLLFLLFTPFILVPSVWAFRHARPPLSRILAKTGIMTAGVLFLVWIGLLAVTLVRGARPLIEIRFAQKAVGLTGPSLFIDMQRRGPGKNGIQAHWVALVPPPIVGGQIMHDRSDRWGLHGNSARYGEYLKIPLWMIAWNFALPCIYLRFASRRPVPGHCRCGYNLTGNTSGICPECGTACRRGFPEEKSETNSTIESSQRTM